MLAEACKNSSGSAARRAQGEDLFSGTAAALVREGVSAGRLAAVCR
ncbi:MAG TPA: hypothetical protein VEG33_10325 [Streptosporangiaceae bacterium]|nr:hypothetical protein [Streptosporangiaceae bacterium]